MIKIGVITELSVPVITSTDYEIHLQDVIRNSQQPLAYISKTSFKKSASEVACWVTTRKTGVELLRILAMKVAVYVLAISASGFWVVG